MLQDLGESSDLLASRLVLDRLHLHRVLLHLSLGSQELGQEHLRLSPDLNTVRVSHRDKDGECLFFCFDFIMLFRHLSLVLYDPFRAWKPSLR